MRQRAFLSLFVGVFLSLSGIAQSFPTVKVKDLEGRTHDTASFLEQGHPIIVSFFGTWCKPCIRELDAINEVYAEWQEETGVVLYAICINEGSDMHKAKPMANAHEWEFEVMLDTTLDFKRALNVQMVPSLFVFAPNGDIIHQSTGYVDGSEGKIIDAIRKYRNKK